MKCYLDTSALAKWYVWEPGSEAFEDFIRSLDEDAAIISPLTITEMRSLLARRRRMRELEKAHEQQAWQTFLRDIASGALNVMPLRDQTFMRAVDLLEQLPDCALRTLDALHLALADQANVNALASGDRIMLRAARLLGLQTHAFH